MYTNTCKSCNHIWKTPLEDGKPAACPKCEATGKNLIGSAFAEENKPQAFPLSTGSKLNVEENVDV